LTTPSLGANRYKFFIAGAIGTFMGTLDGSILNVALPTLSQELSAPVDVVAWVILAYSLTAVSLLMVFGAVAQRRGYYFAYRFGYVFFVTGSSFCALAGSIESLVVARIIQAVGAAMFQAVGTGMITAVFPPEERGKGIGLWVMIVSAGLMVGPPLGGFMLQVWPWRAIFIINIPVGLVGLGLTIKYFRGFPMPKEERPVRWGSAAALAAGLLAGMASLSLLNDFPIGNWRILSLWAVGLLALALFVRLEWRPESALIGLDIFRNRQFVTAISAMLLMFASMGGALILIPFYLERVKGYEPRTVGLFLILLPISMFIFAPLAGRISDKIGYRLLTTGGMLMIALGLYRLSGLQIDSTDFYIVTSILTVGVGTGIFNTPNSSAMMGSVRPDQRAVASAILSTTRNIGMAIGIALATALHAYFVSRLGGGPGSKTVFVQAYHNVIWVSLVLVLVGAILCLTRRNRIHPPDPGPKPPAETG
jgi:EmrB/QacA subfamily drug resistance transporter